MIHSLEVLSENANREYYIYLLDYGWKEPIFESLKDNFARMAELASKNEAAIIMGVGPVGHFENEVFSWHNINGESAENLLPGILITKTNPHSFRKMNLNLNHELIDKDFSFILIPLNGLCNNTTEVMSLINTLFNDIKAKKELKNFSIQKKLKNNIGNRIIDAVILEPNLNGVGINLKKLFVKK